eukprot:gene19885-26589_t
MQFGTNNPRDSVTSIIPPPDTSPAFDFLLQFLANLGRSWPAMIQAFRSLSRAPLLSRALGSLAQVDSSVSLACSSTGVPKLALLLQGDCLRPHAQLRVGRMQRGIMSSALLLEAFDVKVPAMGESISEGTVADVLKKAEAFDVKVPAMGESISEGTVSDVLKKAGDVVVEDETIATIETDKVSIDVKYSGKESATITHILIASGDVVETGKVVCTVEVGGHVAESKPKAAAATKPAAEKPAAAAPPPPPPAPKAAPAPAQASPSPSAPPPSPLTGRPERRVKMTRLRKRVAERLKGAQNTAAMLTTFNEVDMTSLMQMRSAYKDLFFEKHGTKLGFMSAFIKASAYALGEVPAVNGVIDEDEIVYR